MLKIKDINSLLEIIKSLVLNDYEINIKAIYREYPREASIEYFEINYKIVD